MDTNGRRERVKLHIYNKTDGIEHFHQDIELLYVLEGTLFKHLAEIDQVCNERIENIVSAMAKQEGVTEAFKAADQIEWVRRMNSIRNRAEEIVLHELVYDL